MERQKAMEYGSRKALSDVLKPHYIYIYIIKESKIMQSYFIIFIDKSEHEICMYFMDILTNSIQNVVF